MAKYLITLALCVMGAALMCADANDEKEMKKFIETAEACRMEVNATPKDIDDFVKKQPAADMAAKCMRACLFEKYNIMDANGKLVKESAMKHAPMYTNGDAKKMQAAEAVINTCAETVFSANKCEAVEQLEMCFFQQAKALGIEDIEI